MKEIRVRAKLEQKHRQELESLTLWGQPIVFDTPHHDTRPGRGTISKLFSVAHWTAQTLAT